MDRLRTLPFSSQKLPKKVIFSYIGDYVILFVLFVAFVALDRITPYHQQFSLRNYTLQYTYAVKERVPIWLCFVCAFVFPGAVITFYTLVIDGMFSNSALKRKRYRLKDRLWELNCGWLGLALSFGAAFDITGALKNAIGKPRPDLISRCKPVDGAQDPLPFGLSNYTICTETDSHIMNDGFKSFPSGHSSTSFAGLFYLSLYLAGKLHVLDSRGEVWKTVLVITPSLGAALIAGSRIMDARHHPFDVISGSMLGALCAWASYRQYFPPLSDYHAKGRAYPIRSWGKSETIEPYNTYAAHPLRDEEQATYNSSSTALPQQTQSGNAFRDEIHHSQRQRRHDSLRRPGPPQHGAPGSAYSSEEDLHNQPPAGIHHATAIQYRPAGPRDPRRDMWEESDEEVGRELQARTSSKVPVVSMEPLRSHAADTAYRPGGGGLPAAGVPVARAQIPQVNVNPNATGVPSIMVESAEGGDLGGQRRV